MKLSDCVPEKMSKSFVGGFLLVLALAAFISGFTILPLIGFVLTVPLVLLGVYFLRIHVNDQCELEP